MLNHVNDKKTPAKIAAEKLRKQLEGGVNDALNAQTKDVLKLVSERMAVAFVAYTEQYVLPLEARIVWLELPWYLKLWHRFAALFSRETPEQVGEAPDIEPPDQPSHPVQMANQDEQVAL